jgi:hypothetical protein
LTEGRARVPARRGSEGNGFFEGGFLDLNRRTHPAPPKPFAKTRTNRFSLTPTQPRMLTICSGLGQFIRNTLAEFREVLPFGLESIVEALPAIPGPNSTRHPGGLSLSRNPFLLPALSDRNPTRPAALRSSGPFWWRFAAGTRFSLRRCQCGRVSSPTPSVR